MKVFLATNNNGKIERYKNLLQHVGVEVEVFTPKDFGLESIDPIEDGETLEENAQIKARAYFGKVPLSIIANDTGFWVEGEGLVQTPKRTALAGKNEATLTKEEMAKFILEFWKGIAKKHGGKVNAAWVEVFILLNPDGSMHQSESRREVILTDQELGTPHIQMPVRALYISKATNKPALTHTPEEELAEMQPLTEALAQILKSV